MPVGCVNKALVIGALVDEPFKDGDDVCFVLKVTKSVAGRSRDDRRVNVTEEIPVRIVAEGPGKVVMDYGRKGESLVVEGAWSMDEGGCVKVYPMEGGITLLGGDRQRDGDRGGQSRREGSPARAQGRGGSGGGGGAYRERRSESDPGRDGRGAPYGGGDLDDDIPF